MFRGRLVREFALVAEWCRSEVNFVLEMPYYSELVSTFVSSKFFKVKGTQTR